MASNTKFLDHEQALVDGLSYLDNVRIAAMSSRDVRGFAEDHTAALFRETASQELCSAAAEDKEETAPEPIVVRGEGEQRRDQEMGTLCQLGNEKQRENECIETSRFGDSEVDAKPASSQDQIHRDPPATSVCHTAALLESHKIESRSSIEPMPTCDEQGNGNAHHSHLVPGAYAVRATRSINNNSTQAGTETAILDVAASGGVSDHGMVRDEEDAQNLVIANAVHTSQGDLNLPVADPFHSNNVVRHELHPKLRGYLVLFICLMAVVALVSLLLIMNQKETDTETTSPVEIDPSTNSLTPSITFEHGIVELLPDYTMSAITKEGSPQAKALLWLLDDPGIASYPEWRVLQRLSLATLYFSTEGFKWANSSNWMSYDHECTWHSSTIHKSIFEDSILHYEEEVWMEDLKKNLCPCCGASNSSSNVGAYRNLRLISNGLHGALPMELYLLTSLESIAFMTNSLTGTISSHLGMLSELQALNLVAMELEGSLPSEVGLITKLRTLILYTNRLSGQIPSEIGLLQELQELYLEENNFTNTIPSEIGLLANVRHMYFDTNLALTGSIPTEFGLLSSIRDFQIALTSISGNIPSELGRLTSLTNLDLAENELAGQIPPEFSNMSSLMYLKLFDNFLSGTVITEIGRCQNLLTLVLRDNYLTGVVATELGLLTKLKILSVRSNLMLGSIPMEIMSLTRLTSLRLSKNLFTGHIPSEVGLLLSMKTLLVESNAFTGQIPSELGQLMNLTLINLADNHLQGIIPHEVASLPLTTPGFLELFNISNNPHLAGTLPEALCNASEELSIVYDCTNSLCGCACPCFNGTNRTELQSIP